MDSEKGFSRQATSFNRQRFGQTFGERVTFIGRRAIRHLFFADDLVLLLSSERSLQYGLDQSPAECDQAE